MEEPVPLFRFFKENGILFTSSALFAAFYYYVVNLLKDPTAQMNNLNSTVLNVTYAQQNPQVRQILDEVSSLQVAAVISFFVFAIILISVILIALRYDIFTKFLAALLGLLLFYSFIYLIASFRDAIYVVVAIALPLLFVIFYLDLMEEARKTFQNKPALLGIFWYSMLDFLFIIGFEIWELIKNILMITHPTVELVYGVIFLAFCLMMIFACFAFHYNYMIFYFGKTRGIVISYDRDVL
jgi:hypothetical protein